MKYLLLVLCLGIMGCSNKLPVNGDVEGLTHGSHPENVEYKDGMTSL